MSANPITCHILDTAQGCPAAGITIALERGTLSGEDYSWNRISCTSTNCDGRAPDLWTKAAVKSIEPGIYRMLFFTKDYFEAQGAPYFYPKVEVLFQIHDVNQHYHIPLLLSPFGYSTYRGS